MIEWLGRLSVTVDEVVKEGVSEPFDLFMVSPGSCQTESHIRAIGAFAVGISSGFLMDYQIRPSGIALLHKTPPNDHSFGVSGRF